MKKFYYHVVYSANKDVFLTPIMGCSQIIRATRIESFDDLNNLREVLEEKYGFKNLVIVNLIQLKHKKGRK